MDKWKGALLNSRQMASTGGRKTRSLGRGPDLVPLRNLLEAQNIYNQYKDPAGRDEATRKLSQAVGSDKPLPLLRENLDKVFDPDSTLSDIALTLTLAESRKRRVAQ
jgi:hypothetical protein